MKVIGLPVVKDDKTTLVGTCGVVINSLLLTEMIKKRKEKNHGDTRFTASNELPSKLLVLFGDGFNKCSIINTCQSKESDQNLL